MPQAINCSFKGTVGTQHRRKQQKVNIEGAAKKACFPLIFDAQKGGMERASKLMCTCSFPFLIMSFIVVIASFSPGFASEKVTVPQEEIEMLKDYGNALKDTVSGTKSELENIQKKYIWVKDTFGNHKYPKILKLINILDKNGLGIHLKNSISTLKKHETGLKKITDIKAGYDKIVAFSDRYKPDKDDPLRSLQQISNSLEDLNYLIEKIDPSGGMLTKPIREIIGFYQQSAGAFHGALGRVKNKIKERGGGGIGLGFTAYTDKERLFIKKFPGETAYRYPWIKYIKPRSSQEEVEFWDNKSDRAFAWRNKNWIEIKPGVAGLRKAYDGLRIAFGTRPDINTLISRCNTGWDKVLQAEKNGKKNFNILFSNNACVSKILAYKKIKLERFPEKKFIARYTFRRDSRKKVDQAVKIIKNSIIVEGRITEQENNDKGLDNIIITAESSGSRAQATSESGGWFTLFFSLNPSDSRGNARVTINASDYKSYSKDLPLRQQCNSWYNISLVSEEENLVKVPELIGLTTPKAREILKKLELIPIKTDGGMPPSIGQSDMITWQKPEKYKMVEKGSKVSFQAYWEVVEDTPPPAAEEEETEPNVTTDPESTTEPEVVDENSDNAGDGLEGYVGGLIIAGKTEIISGEGVSYTACDGSGKPYPADKNFSWNSSVETVLVLGKSGQPVSGSGFKAGTSTIILHYDGMTKYLDVKVRVRVPDVTNMSTKQAVGTIEGLNLRTSITGDRENVDNLAVVFQTPAPGTIVDADYTIILEPGDKKANMFSMSGGEKVEENKSIFSMSGGGKNSNQNSAEENSNTSTSLVNSNSNNSLTANQATTSNIPENSTNNNSEQKIIIRYQHVSDTKGNVLEMWMSWQCYWNFEIKLQNVSLKDIKNKNKHLLVKINNRPFYFYNFAKSLESSTKYYSDNDLCIEGRIPFRGVGNNTIEISCPALPHIPTVTKQFIVDPPSGRYLTKWKSHVSQNAYIKLNQFKQQYEQAVAGDPSDVHYYYNVVRTSKNYAKTLVLASESYCHLGNFKSAKELNALAIPVLKKNLSVHESSGPKHASSLDFDYLIKAYYRQANISLMGLDDKKEYIANINAAINLSLISQERTNYKQADVTFYASQAAENLLTLGFRKSDVEQYYNLAIKYMDKNKLIYFMDLKNPYAYGCPNCKEFFVYRPHR